MTIDVWAGDAFTVRFGSSLQLFPGRLFSPKLNDELNAIHLPEKTKVLIALFSVDWMSLTLEEQKLMQQKSHQDLMSYLSQSSRVGLGVKVRTRC